MYIVNSAVTLVA